MFTKNGSSRGGVNFSFFAFMVVFLTFPIRRACVRPTLDLLDGSVRARYFPLVAVYSWMQCFPRRLGWIELKQNIHYDVVEDDVWHTTPDMLDRKCRKTYRMSFLAFEQLVAELTPFLRPTAQMFVRPPIPIGKQMCLIVYRLAHDFSCKAMNNLYGYRLSIIRKYTLIICRILYSRNGLFGTYIHAPRGHRLMNIICRFRDLTGLPNVVSAIDGIHIHFVY